MYTTKIEIKPSFGSDLFLCDVFISPCFGIANNSDMTCVHLIYTFLYYLVTVNFKYAMLLKNMYNIKITTALTI